ncbi:guanylate kinase [Cohnella faecalis]|nr:hypothetical protein [Cohnella faecalis]
MGKIFVLYGPSASGKTEIQKQITSGRLPRIITATTRAPRDNEIDGEHYIFMSKSEFRSQIENGRFIEWTEYGNELYGTLKDSAENIVSGNGSANIILDFAGVRALKRLYADTFAIFIGANIESIERRLLLRAGTDEELNGRLTRARELELSPEYLALADAVVWNDDGADFEETLAKVQGIISSSM